MIVFSSKFDNSICSLQKSDQTVITPKGAKLASDTSSVAAKAKSSKGMKNKGAQSQAPGQKFKKI